MMGGRDGKRREKMDMRGTGPAGNESVGMERREPGMGMTGRAGAWKMTCLAIRIVYPVMVLAPILPTFYMMSDARAEFLIRPLYFAFFVLLIPSAVSKVAVEKVRTLTAYILICGAALVATWFAAVFVSGFLPWDGVEAYEAAYRAAMLPKDVSVIPFKRLAYLVVVMVEAVVLTSVMILVRLNRTDRARSRRDRDLSWTERRYLLDRPNLWLLIWFVVLYVLALVFTCREGCDIAAMSFLVCGAMFLFYRHAEMTDRYLTRLDYLVHMPGRRIRVIGAVIALALVGAALAAGGLTGRLTSALRPYYDLRNFQGRVGPAIELEWEKMLEQSVPSVTPEGLELMEPTEPWKYIWIFEFLAKLIFAGIVVWVVWILIRRMRGVFSRFREAEGEEGPPGTSVEPDRIQKITPARRRRTAANTPEEQVRREYRRAIRKARKEMPRAYESPEEIEREAGLLGTEGMAELHERYERARYGGTV